MRRGSAVRLRASATSECVFLFARHRPVCDISGRPDSNFGLGRGLELEIRAEQCEACLCVEARSNAGYTCSPVW